MCCPPVSLASNSTQAAPWRLASRSDSSVFSGAAFAAPRCPMMRGMVSEFRTIVSRHAKAWPWHPRVRCRRLHDRKEPAIPAKLVDGKAPLEPGLAMTRGTASVLTNRETAIGVTPAVRRSSGRAAAARCLRRSSGRRAFIDSLTLPRSSKPRTLTFTWSPTLTTSPTLLDALRRQLGDVDEAVLAAEEVHEGAEIDDLHDLAV